MEQLLSIIIVNWNTKEMLNKCIQSIKRTTKISSYEIIVVDNASSDGSAEYIGKLHPDIRIIKNDKNLGFSAANNIGIRKSKGKFICLSNSDIKVLENAIDELVQYIAENKSIGMIGPKTLNDDLSMRKNCRNEITLWNVFVESVGLQNIFKKNRFINDGLMTYFEHDKIKSVDVLPACFIVLRKVAINDVGLLDEKFYFYGEDKDWCKRFKAKNWDIIFYPNSKVIHYAGKSSSLAPFRFMIERFKSNQYYWLKHKGRKSMKVYLLLQMLLNMNRLGWSIVKHIITKRSKLNVRMTIDTRMQCSRWLIKQFIAN